VHCERVGHVIHPCRLRSAKRKQKHMKIPSVFYFFFNNPSQGSSVFCCVYIARASISSPFSPLLQPGQDAKIYPSLSHRLVQLLCVHGAYPCLRRFASPS
jgi:hypothetical protein